MAVSGGDTLLDLLKSCGIEYIFCSPGTEWTPVWEGLLKRQGEGDTSLKYINCRHEMLAVSMAMGYAESTGRLPAVLLHAGVGSLHGAMAVRNALVAQVPMLIFSGETYEHSGAGGVRAQGAHWIGLLSDMGGPSSLVKGCTKWSNAVKSLESLMDSVYRGCQIARTLPRGPVFLSVPSELLQRSQTEITANSPPAATVSSVPDQSGLEEAARQLLSSKKPVIITEHAGRKPGTVDKLTELAGLLSIPVFESVFPYFANIQKDNPLFMGYDPSEAIAEADTVFVCGSTTPWYPPSTCPRSGTRIILLDEDILHQNLPYWGYHPHLSLSGDIDQGLKILIDLIRADMGRENQTDARYQERAGYWLSRHQKMVDGWKAEAASEEKNRPISSKWFFHRAHQILPANSIIVDETISHIRFIHRYLAEPGRYFRAGYGGLGVGLGEAAGVKLANQDKPVVLLIGDGAFNYNPVMAGLGVSQEYGLPLLILVLNNGGYVAMERGYHTQFPQGWAVNHGTFLGVNIAPAPEYAKLAGVFGAYGEKLEEPGDIEQSLNRGLEQIKQGKTALIDVILK